MPKDPDAASDSDEKPRTPTAQVARPTKILPSDRMRFARQLDILRAYAAGTAYGTKPAMPHEIATIMNMKVDTLRMALPFFADNGLLLKSEGAARYTPSQDTVKYARAFDFKEETAGPKLAPALKSTWFMGVLEPKLAYHALAEDEAILTLADAAGAGKQHTPQLRSLLDYLAIAGLITRENGEVRLNKTNPEEPQDLGQVKQNGNGAAPSIVTTVATPPAPNAGLIKFQINVNVDMQQMADWEEGRIKAFFAGLAQMLAANKGNEPVSEG